MANLKSGIPLDANETLVMELEAEMWASSQNPIARLQGAIVRILHLIFGFRRRGFIVITDKRVVVVVDFKALWVFNTGKDVTYVLPSSVKEIGYSKKGTFCGCFCQAYNLYYGSFTHRTSVLLPVSSDFEAKKIVDAFYNAISANQ